ncbi:hypothetical protein [Arthrobacter sp. TB 26]|nr:hypothetical protein [Arthrobacter sp. TB 26]
MPYEPHVEVELLVAIGAHVHGHIGALDPVAATVRCPAGQRGSHGWR